MNSQVSKILLKIYVASICFLALLFHLIPTFPRLQDYGKWIYQSWLVSQVWSVSEAQELYFLLPYPVPNATLFITLMQLFSMGEYWYLASKIIVVAYIIFFLFALYKLSKHWKIQDEWMFIICGFIYLTFTHTWWNGFISYHLSLLFLILFLSKFDKTTTPLAIILFGIFIFFSHAVGWFVFVLLIVGNVILKQFDKKQLVGLLPSICLAAWYLLGRFIHPITVISPDAEFSSVTEAMMFKIYAIIRCGPFQTFQLLDGQSITESMPILYYLGFGWNLVFAVVTSIVVGWFILFGDKLQAQYGNVPILSIRCLATIFLIAHFILPYNFMGLFHLGERLLIPMLAIILMLVLDHYRPLRFWMHGNMIFFLVTIILYGLSITSLESNEIIEYQTKAHTIETPEVDDFIEVRYKHTQHTYFNHKIFGYGENMDVLDQKTYMPIHLNNGPLINRAD